jgi:Domain of unknown function (DUF4338)
MKSKIINLKAREAKLKRRIRGHLKKLGFTRDSEGRLVPSGLDKDAYRKVHEEQRRAKLEQNRAWLARNAEELSQHLADGRDVVPEEISPELRLVESGTWESDLFRLASFNWRVPVSDGYGRRMRFLVWDQSNDRLIGLLALGDAVFNQRARDEYIGWDHNQRTTSLVHLMDAYVLGAVPPYSNLLGGKLVASLIRSKEVVRAFEAKYSSSVGLISKAKKNARLAAVTTSSALGRSSIYNRLSLNGSRLLEPIGFTSGFGHFHLSGSIFDELRDYLVSCKDPYAEGFEYGEGPNWKIRVIRKALERLGMDQRLTQHGFQREVYFCSVADNAINFLTGKNSIPRYRTLMKADEIAELAKSRWMIPRASRDPSFSLIRREHFLSETLRAIPARKKKDAVGA